MTIKPTALLLFTATAAVATAYMRPAFARRPLRAAMRELPAGVVKYSQVPKGKTFTVTTIPRGLLKEHNTKVGTWGKINVLRGKLEYQINEPQKSVFELSPSKPGFIEPQIRHQVKPLTDDVEFVVEFYRFPNTGPVHEPREGL